MKVTVDDMVGAILELGKPCTKQEIADVVGVTRQTIANHSDKLEGDSRVEYGQVGKATAYWLKSDGFGFSNNSKTRIDDMVDAIREADRPTLTESDIGEKIGVTRRTVSNYRNELEQHPEVEYGEVGQARAYWIEAEEHKSDPNESFDGLPNDEMERFLQNLTRAVRYEILKQQFESGSNLDHSEKQVDESQRKG